VLKFLIKDYLETVGKKTFAEVPFNEVDFAICGSLSYADFVATSIYSTFNHWEDRVPLSVFNKHETIKLLSRRYLSGPLVFYNFFKALVNSKRYEELRITKFRNVMDDVNYGQFCGMVFEFNDRKIIIYRGTDNTITGWKEDFLTAIHDKIPSQQYALQYLDDVLQDDKEHDYYILGHSKGGNLAYYAFFNTSDENRNRIIYCYNMDGNGFKNDTFDYKKYKKKISKIVPNEDVVGCIFDTFSFKHIVESDAKSIFAHDMLSWKINPKTKNTFVHASELTRFTKAYQVSINYWVQHLSEEDLGDFIDFIFSLVDLGNPKTLDDISHSFKVNSLVYFKTLNKYPAEKKKRIKAMCLNFLKDFTHAYLTLPLIEKKDDSDAKSKEAKQYGN